MGIKSIIFIVLSSLREWRVIQSMGTKGPSQNSTYLNFNSLFQKQPILSTYVLEVIIISSRDQGSYLKAEVNVYDKGQIRIVLRKIFIILFLFLWLH